jgi:hypothetical protein
MGGMRITKLDLFLLCTNLTGFGAAMALLAIRGPSGPIVLLAIGSSLMAVAKIGKALTRSAGPDPESGG